MYGGQRRSLRTAAAAASQAAASVDAEDSDSSSSSEASENSGGSGSSEGSGSNGGSGKSGRSGESSRGSRTKTPQHAKGSLIQLMLDSQASGLHHRVQEEEEEASDNENEEGEEFGDMHRLVLQGVMAAGYLDAKGVKKLFQESCRFLQCKVPAAEHMSPPFIQKVVREINEKIKHLDMMIRSATCEVTGEKYYVCLVTIEKQIMKVQTFFTKFELDIFQKIINSVLRQHNNFLVPLNECINMGSELDARFSKIHVEDFINKMIGLQYLAKVYKDDDDFEITLGFRTIREFEPIFRDSYDECFGTCSLCKMILLNGLICPKCPTVYHRACLKKYIKTCKMCVSCKETWKNENSLPIRTMDGTGEPSSSFVTKKKSQGSFSQATATPIQTRKAKGLANKTATGSGTGDEVDMPILVPMVSPKKAQVNQGPKRGQTGDTQSTPKEATKTTPRTLRGKQGVVQRKVASSSSSGSGSESESD